MISQPTFSSSRIARMVVSVSLVLVVVMLWMATGAPPPIAVLPILIFLVLVLNICHLDDLLFPSLLSLALGRANPVFPQDIIYRAAREIIPAFLHYPREFGEVSLAFPEFDAVNMGDFFAHILFVSVNGFIKTVLMNDADFAFFKNLAFEIADLPGRDFKHFGGFGSVDLALNQAIYNPQPAFFLPVHF
jgi:hypothetical protein